MTEETKNTNQETIDTKEIVKVEEKIEKAAIPYDRFKEVIDEKKALKLKLDVFEEKEKKRIEDKLLEEKKFEELLKAKDLELETHKNEKETLKKNMLIEKVNNKIINIASKEGAIDSDDILRFIKTQDLLDLESDKLSDEVNKRVTEIKNNKAHLFNTNQRDSKENGMPYSVNTNNTKSSKPKTKEDMVLEALNLSRKK